VQDVAAKLGLKSVADTEAVVAKAIRDGSLSAALDHEKQWLVSRELGDAYITDEPQRALHARTAFCMDIHNEAVRAMRFDVAADTSAAPTAQEKKAGIEEAIAAAMADDADEF
jgi:26S proteasome regulatory subunit N3